MVGVERYLVTPGKGQCGLPLAHAEDALVACLGYGQVVSFNMGSLGFLTNHQFPEFKSDLAGVMAGTEALEQCSPEGATVRPFPRNRIHFRSASAFVSGLA